MKWSRLSRCKRINIHLIFRRNEEFLYENILNALLHFFTQRPNTDLTLHLDNLTLLRKDESLLEPGPKFVRQLVALKLDHVGAAEKTLAKSREYLSKPSRVSCPAMPCFCKSA